MMILSLLTRRDRTTSVRRHPRTFQPGLQPVLEGLEERTMLSAAVASPAAQVARPTQTTTINVMPQLNVNNVTVVNNTLNAVVALGNQVVNVPLTLSARPNPGNAACPILDLRLGEIHLDLLGLNVDTSEICLSVTAYEGGGLLGDLLCDVANLLNGGTPLGDILGGLTSINAGDLLSGLTNLLNSGLDATTATSAAGTGTDATDLAKVAVLDTSAGACDILNLSLGPVDLTLLGLNVHLDNCHNGPVTVDITADPGGGLLGDLLCDLNDLLGKKASARSINQLLTNIQKEIGKLV